MMTKRILLPWPWWRRVWREVVWAMDWDDGSGDGSASLTKMMATALLVLACIAILRRIPVSGMQSLLIAMAISAAFGRGMWKHYLTRGSWSASTSDTTSRVTTHQIQEIVERRKAGAEDGTEPI